LENITADFIGQNIAEKVEGTMEYQVNPMHRSMGLDLGKVWTAKTFRGNVKNQQGI
jgi:hypothetical protein